MVVLKLSKSFCYFLWKKEGCTLTSCSTSMGASRQQTESTEKIENKVKFVLAIYLCRNLQLRLTLKLDHIFIVLHFCSTIRQRRSFQREILTISKAQYSTNMVVNSILQQINLIGNREFHRNFIGYNRLIFLKLSMAILFFAAIYDLSRAPFKIASL